MEKLNTKIVEGRFNQIFRKTNCAAKVNLASEFILRNVENGKFRCFYAHEKNTLLDRSKLVCTGFDTVKLEEVLNKTDVIEKCVRERINSKWIFYRLINLTVFAASLKDLPKGCRGEVLPDESNNELAHFWGKYRTTL